MADSVAMSGLPHPAAAPLHGRCPRHVPLSFEGRHANQGGQFRGLSVGNSGRHAMTVQAVRCPTPGTLCSRSSCSRQAGVWRKNSRNSLSNPATAPQATPHAPGSPAGRAGTWPAPIETSRPRASPSTAVAARSTPATPASARRATAGASAATSLRTPPRPRHRSRRSWQPPRGPGKVPDLLRIGDHHRQPRRCQGPTAAVS